MIFLGMLLDIKERLCIIVAVRVVAAKGGLTGGAVAIEKENKDMNWVALDSIDFVEGIHE